MPIYEYRCDKCGIISEFLEGVTSEKTHLRCPGCGSEQLTKLLSRSFRTRKGSGLSPRAGRTCCGREERCDSPPCADGSECRR